MCAPSQDAPFSTSENKRAQLVPLILSSHTPFSVGFHYDVTSTLIFTQSMVQIPCIHYY